MANTSDTDWKKIARSRAARIARLEKALAPLAEAARIHKLYEGSPCNNARHSSDMTVCYVEHGRDAVTITLGQCRAAAKLLGRRH